MECGGELQEILARFDDEFWRQEVKQGHYASSQRFVHAAFSRKPPRSDIPIKHLYVEYRTD